MTIERNKPEEGCQTVYCDFYAAFHDYLQRNGNVEDYVWRGQQCDWPLVSSLERVWSSAPAKPALAAAHMEQFKLAARGRLGKLNPTTDEDWWSLGQHYGLRTPYLDWSKAPYIASFFAFEEELPRDVIPDENRRIIFGLHKRCLNTINNSYLFQTDSEDFGIRFHESRLENRRLLSQNGLLTWTPWGKDVEKCVRHQTAAGMLPNDGIPNLVRICILERERSIAIKSLRLMNISPMSIMPDLTGSTAFANINLTL